jgi:diacylglycerol kinase (ATP)
LAKKYLSQGFDYIVSVGGDGTNNEVVNGVMEYMNENENVHKFILGFIPYGSGCDWERTFGLEPEGLDYVAKCIADGYIVPCDVGHVEALDNENKKINRFFLNGLIQNLI